MMIEYMIPFVNEILKQEGTLIVSADNGEEASEVLNNNDVQLAILDADGCLKWMGLNCAQGIREKYSYR